MTTLKNNWIPGDGFFSADANAIATQINQNTVDVAAAAAAVSGKQPSDADLTSIAALTPADGDTILRVAGAWVNRTMAQLKTALAFVKSDVGLGLADNTADINKPVSTLQAAADATVLSSANSHADSGDATLTAAVAARVGLVQAAKYPDLLVTGAVTVDGNDLVTSAAVVWPDGSPGTLTITSRDSNNAVLAYNITYGSPVTRTYTQPTITRNAGGAATTVPAIVVT